jgi:hypothetical protein
MGRGSNPNGDAKQRCGEAIAELMPNEPIHRNSISLRLIGARSTSDRASVLYCAHAVQRRLAEDPK